MEIRARTILIGLFMLAVIAAGFGFTYWLKGSGGLAGRTPYRVVFTGPVSGLLRGSAVLFNGIRIGEVSRLQLDPTDPRVTFADIAVNRDVLIRADTKVGIEFQGLTGAPVVSLIGGDVGAAPVLASTSEPAMLRAEKNAGVGMNQAARDALAHINDLITTNAKPVQNLISNIDKFAGALARNSDRVDGIVAGLERLTGGGPAKPQTRIYDLSAAPSVTPLAKIPTGQLAIPEPVALTVFETEKIVVRSSQGDVPLIERAQWPDLLAKVIQARLVQSFENSGYAGALGRGADAVKSEHQLLLEVRAFHIDTDQSPTARVELAARIVDADGRVVATRVFKQSRQVALVEAQAAARGLNASFMSVAGEIVGWTCGLI